jgi:hypothetical protein
MLCRISILSAFAYGLIFAQAPTQQSGSTILAIAGDVAMPVTLNAEDLSKMPRESVSVDDQDGTKVQYEGVLLREVMKRAGAPLGNQLRGKALASYIVAKGHDGYQVVFGLAEIDPAFANEQILVADKRDGMPLFAYQGQFRLVCPNDKAGARSVRMLETLELVRLAK